MSTIAEFRLPAADTVLTRTFERVPDATFELESSVSKTLPCLWVSGADAETIEAAFDADPSVTAYERLVEAADRLLYDLEFDGEDPLYEDLLADGGALLDVHGADDHWQIRMRFRDRDQLCRTHDRLVDRGVNADLRRVTDVTAAATTNSRLTPEQQEALSAALEHGYFEIPRQISMEELAAELGISHQALSERLRRAYETLVDAELQPVDS
ncbi:helix-turn-helix domain-containing protein [Natrononativus amylolyticus]|uniref:helix-turn-helix domain-containing protein n=1 Tax=Natrononativus amylolyticus TaxID=2963434 RepID=UPI0020CEDE44|nr:helix-turn-helix domain-containing protein [Natrononativus amylolyticus]